MGFIKRNALVGLITVLVYIFVRIGGDPWWRTLTSWAAYSFEIVFVVVVGFIYRERLNLRTSILFALTSSLLATGAGFSIYKLIVSAGLKVPFDFNSGEILFLLLLFGPILEELIFRMALWDSLSDLFKKKNDLVLITTTLLFSIGRLQAFWSVPLEYRPFVLIQALLRNFTWIGLWIWSDEELHFRSYFCPSWI